MRRADSVTLLQTGPGDPVRDVGGRPDAFSVPVDGTVAGDQTEGLAPPTYEMVGPIVLGVAPAGFML